MGVKVKKKFQDGMRTFAKIKSFISVESETEK